MAQHLETPRFPLHRWATLFLAFWTIVAAFFTWYAFHLIDESTMAQVHAKAIEAFNKDQMFRLWATMHGGVYVPQTEKTPPNKYLTHLPEQNITTPSGKKLTLMNPAYMVRQFNENFSALHGTAGRITSLKPLRPENRPDDWERSALRKLEAGADEVYEITTRDGDPLVRLMRPMHVTEGCLKCHAHQGYEIGDIRGGVSVTVSTSAFLAAGNTLKMQSGVLLVSLWFLGVIVILFGARLLKKNFRERDILSADLLKATESAEAANAAKTMFLANMSHEIRTPLNGITGLLKLLKDSPMSGEQTEFVDAAILSGNRLTYLLSDLLNLSMVEKGILPFRMEPVDLVSNLNHIRKIFNVTAHGTEVALDFNIAPDVPKQVMTDPTRLQQIFTNLIGNALKFTKQGKVVLDVSPLPHAPYGRQHLLFVVSDTGNGIPNEKIEAAFAPFSQMDSGYTKNYQGAGLGLAICKRLVDAAGGSICVDSEPGVGTSVYCSLPFDIVKSPKPKTTLPADPGGMPTVNMSILLAEDDRVNQLVAERLLSRIGCRITSVGNGAEAIDALRAEPFDLILMDVQMPMLNGVDATLAIRNGEAGEDRKQTPIIALTAYAMDGDSERFTEAGMDGYVPKPIDVSVLVATIGKFAPEE